MEERDDLWDQTLEETSCVKNGMEVWFVRGSGMLRESSVYRSQIAACCHDRVMVPNKDNNIADFVRWKDEDVKFGPKVV